MTELVLGLDIGTQGSKALLVDDGGKVRARASADYGLIPDLPPGHGPPSEGVDRGLEVPHRSRLFELRIRFHRGLERVVEHLGEGPIVAWNHAHMELAGQVPEEVRMNVETGE